MPAETSLKHLQKSVFYISTSEVPRIGKEEYPRREAGAGRGGEQEGKE